MQELLQLIAIGFIPVPSLVTIMKDYLLKLREEQTLSLKLMYISKYDTLLMKSKDLEMLKRERILLN